VLVRAADEAESLFTMPAGEVATRAMAQERARFASQVRQWSATPDLQAERVGYRRVLTDDESAQWRERLTARWGLVNLAWHPMISTDIPSEVMILRGDSMWEKQNVELVRHALHSLHAERMVELREHGPEYVLEVDLMAPRYTGAEGVWADESLSWIAYASHEQTVAIGGTLAESVAKIWPDIEVWRWSPDFR